MAIEKEIPKDIKQYEPKLMGPFTTRQVFCLIPAMAIGIGLFFGLQNFLTVDVRLFVITFVAVPFFFLGWYKPYNLPFEKFIKSIFISTVLSPPHRKYKTSRLYLEPGAPKRKLAKSSKKKKNLPSEFHPFF